MLVSTRSDALLNGPEREFRSFRIVDGVVTEEDVEVVDHLGDGGALGLDGLLAAGVGTQDGGDGNGHGHAQAPAVVG